MWLKSFVWNQIKYNSVTFYPGTTMAKYATQPERFVVREMTRTCIILAYFLLSRGHLISSHLDRL